MNDMRPAPTWLPALGCFSVVAVLMLLCLMPLLLVDVMRFALERLHLSPPVALLSIVGIFIGSMINLPLYHIQRDQPQPIQVMGPFGMWGSGMQRLRNDTLIAANVGGCIIPILLAFWQVLYLVQAGGWPLQALLVVLVCNIGVCYAVARPVSGIGILMPGFLSPLVAVGMTWLLLGPAEFEAVRAPVAFVGGIAGPLIGADLLHLKDITRISVGMLSIGGAGTFDGIVLSGVLAAILA